MTQKVTMPEPTAYLYVHGEQEGVRLHKCSEMGLYAGTIEHSLITTTQAEAYAASCVREAQKWINVDDRLPEIGDWVNVLFDRNEGDFFERNGKPRYSVYGAQLREVDNEGYATWQRWKMADGGPMGALYLVTHWMPLPPPPSNDNEQGK